MADVIGRHIVKTRKPHVCFGCGRQFQPGTIMERSCVVDVGLWTCYLCDTCQEIAASMPYGDDFGYGDLREEALEKEGITNGR